MTPAGFSGDASPMASPPLLRRGSRNIELESPYQLRKRGVRQYECLLSSKIVLLQVSLYYV